MLRYNEKTGMFEEDDNKHSSDDKNEIKLMSCLAYVAKVIAYIMGFLIIIAMIFG